MTLKGHRLGGLLVLAAIAVATFIIPDLAVAAEIASRLSLQPSDALWFIAPALAPAVADIEELKSLAGDFVKATEEVKSLAEDFNRKYAAGNALSTEAKEKADQALTRMNELNAQLGALEQLIARRANDNGPTGPKSMGETLTSHENFAAWAAARGRLGRFGVEVSGPAGLTQIGANITSDPASAGPLLQDQRIQGIMGLPERRMTVRGLLLPGRTASQSITYYKEAGFTNNADVVTEGTLKPQSEITFEEVTSNVATIAHWIKASKQILSDVPQLQSFIDGRLRYGYSYKEEGQLLNGTGTGGELSGLIANSTAFAAPFVLSDATMVDKVRLALLQAALAEYPSNGVVLNPIDWARIELTKDGEGRYIFANPQGVAQPRLWGVPVVPTQAMVVDKFLAGAFGMAAQIFDREDVTVQLSDEDGDNFVKNMVTVLCEGRLTLAVYREEALIYGDFGNV